MQQFLGVMHWEMNTTWYSMACAYMWSIFILWKISQRLHKIISLQASPTTSMANIVMLVNMTKTCYYLFSCKRFWYCYLIIILQWKEELFTQRSSEYRRKSSPEIKSFPSKCSPCVLQSRPHQRLKSLSWLEPPSKCKQLLIPTIMFTK